MNKHIPLEIKKKVLKRDDFKCQKCSHQDFSTEQLELHHIVPKIFGGEHLEKNLVTLCSICHRYAPDTEKEFKIYLGEKIKGELLNTFRKSGFSISQKTKKGMARKASEGGFITKAPRGYKLVSKNLIINPEQEQEVREIFKKYLETDISLTQLGKKHNMTTAGIKKLLKNTTYIGEVKFAGQIHKGLHKSIINPEIFYAVQRKIG